MARIVVTGGAGFLGSHLCDRLIERGDRVVCIDNLVTGRVENIEHLFGERRFQFVRHNVSDHIWVPGAVDGIMHLASPASPIDFERIPIQILKVGSLGTHNCLGLALEKGARFHLNSTSEVYGDPLVHPQPESYWGNVNPVGPRSMYDEAKRFAEALTVAYRRDRGVDVRIVRTFNTYGPRMRPEDGRVVSSFIIQALKNEPITIFGEGQQTRSFCYVDDQIEGQLRLFDSNYQEPMNIGSEDEFTIRELAIEIIALTNSTSELAFLPLPPDDPQQRRPDLTVARRELGWEPSVSLRDGLTRTVEHFAAGLGV